MAEVTVSMPAFHTAKFAKNRFLYVSMASGILTFSLLYLLAIGPYWKITPDSTLYVMAAESIAAGEGYTLRGRPVPVVPPMTSLIFSLGILVFPGSYSALNAAVVTLTLFSLILTFILFKNGIGTPQALILVLLCLGSTSLFLHSTFLLSDIIYLFFSLLALVMIQSLLKTDSGWLNHALIGIIVLAACMTRIVGLALIAAMIAHIIASWLKRRATPSPVLIIMLLMVMLMVSLWEYGNNLTGHSNFKLFLQKEPWIDEAGYTSATGLVARFFGNIERYGWIGIILTNRMLEPFGTIQKYVAVVPITFFLLGLVISLKSQSTVAALYTAIYLSLIVAFQGEAGARYFVPILPFLFYYSFLGLRWFVQTLAKFTAPAIPRLISVGAVCYLIAYLCFGLLYMVRAIPEEHKSPFGVYSIKYKYNYDTQRLAMWLKDHSAQDDSYLTQHADMMDIMTQRKGYNFPFSQNPQKLLEFLREKEIRYVLADNKKWEVQKYLLPAIKAFPDEFNLIRDEKSASLYQFKLQKH